MEKIINISVSISLHQYWLSFDYISFSIVKRKIIYQSKKKAKLDSKLNEERIQSSKERKFTIIRKQTKSHTETLKFLSSKHSWEKKNDNLRNRRDRTITVYKIYPRNEDRDTIIWKLRNPNKTIPNKNFKLFVKQARITSPTFKTRVQTRTNALNVSKHFAITDRWAIIILLNRIEASRICWIVFRGKMGLRVGQPDRRWPTKSNFVSLRVIFKREQCTWCGNSRVQPRREVLREIFSDNHKLNRYRYIVRELSPLRLFIFCQTIVDFIS